MDDFDRPLNDRGKKDAPHMAERLKEKKITIDAIVSSPAKRAFTTCQEFLRILELSEKKCSTEKKLYHADPGTLLETIKHLNDSYNSVMIFGHNPGITAFANSLFQISIDNIPTTGIVAGTLTIKSWKDAEYGCGKLLFFDYPRNENEE